MLELLNLCDYLGTCWPLLDPYTYMEYGPDPGGDLNPDLPGSETLIIGSGSVYYLATRSFYVYIYKVVRYGYGTGHRLDEKSYLQICPFVGPCRTGST